MSEISSNQNIAEAHLSELIAKDPNDWETRKKLAQLLYNADKTQQAAEIIWNAPEIPSIDLELGFAIKVLGKGAPSKAIRLLNGVLELNKGKAVQNLGLANALLHHGMVMQAARFYGAAMAIDTSLANPDLEHFLLWIDDKEKLWGDFEKDKPDLAELPWMKRDTKEAELLKRAMQGHTTPVKIPNLSEVTAETVVHDMYVQSPRPGSQPTPPPAVTIPMDRVDPKHVVYDSERGAGEPITANQAQQAIGPVGGSSGQPLPPAPAAPGAPTVGKSLLTPGLATPPTIQPAQGTPLTPPQPLTPPTAQPAQGTPLTPPQPLTPPTAQPAQGTPLTPPQPLTPPTAQPAQGTPLTPPKPLTPPQPLTPPAASVTPADAATKGPAPITPTTTPAGTNPLSTPGLATPPPTPAATPIAAATPLSPPAAGITPQDTTPDAPLTPAAPAQKALPPLTASPAPIATTTAGATQSPAHEIAQAAKVSPTQIASDGKIVRNPMASQGGDTPAPLIKPIRTSTLVDGKIVINRPTKTDDGQKADGP